MSGLNPLELGETPDDYIEQEDGSVLIPDVEEAYQQPVDFLDNLAEWIDEGTLQSLGGELVELIEKDKQAREKRDQQYQDGIRRTGLGNDAPGGAQFEGASKVVHPVLAEGCVEFAARAMKELFPPSGPVRTSIVGEAPAETLDRAERKCQFMNWQLTTDMPEYRSELEQLLTQLPLGGSQYQKFYYDERLGRTVSEFVPIDEIFLPFAATNFYTAQRATHRQLITRQEYQRRVNSGLYRDVDLIEQDSIPDRSASATANDKVEGKQEDCYNEDGLRAVLEIYLWEAFQDDPVTGGETAPYIITVDEYTEKVLAIYRNWEETDPAMEKLEWIVEWKFIPWRGAYAIGLPHLIGGMSAALTGSLRALLDTAHINNTAAMLKLKSGRVVGQTTSVDVTGVTEIEAPAGVDDIRKIAMPMPFNQPSPVLFQLLDWLTGAAKGVVATADEKIGQVGDRTPVGTTMALIEQGGMTYSAIHGRLHESQKKAFEILQRLNKMYLDPERVAKKLGKVIVTREDFTQSGDIVPVSDPSIFSEAQRFAQMQSVMQLVQQDAQNPSIPWNQVEVRRRALKLMKVDGVDEILPPAPKPVTADPLTENDAAMTGAPVKADMRQDHMAHIQAHISYLSSPLVVMNPLVQGQALMPLLMHVQQHLQMLFASTVAQLAQQMGMQAQAGMVPPMSPDQAIAVATEQANQQISQQLAPVLQKIAQLQQQIQQKMPQPPMPPEVQANLQIGMAEIERKKAVDQAEQQRRSQELQGRQSLDQTELQIKQYEAQMLSKIEELRAQVELMKNERDNRQKQETELAKNHEDGLVNLQIATMEQQGADRATARQAELDHYANVVDSVLNHAVKREEINKPDPVAKD